MPTLPGSTYLTARALLECPRTISTQPPVLVLDAIISTKEAVNDSHVVICSLTLKKVNEHIDFVSGVYDIVAKVCFFPAMTT